MNNQYKSALLTESQNEIVNEIISALENNHLTTGVAGWTSDDYYIETFTSGGGYIHTLILLNNKHIVAIHFEDGIVEYSFDKFDTIEDYLSEKNQDNEKGFGWEFMQPNHEYRTAELSEGGFTKFFKNVANEKFKDGGNIFVNKKYNITYSVEQRPDGRWTVYAESPNFEKNDQYAPVGLASKEDAIDLAMLSAGIKKEADPESYFMRREFKHGGKMEDGGVIGQEIVFDDTGEENTGVIKDIHEITGDYIVATDDGRTVLASKELDVISLGKVREPKAKKRFAFFEDGGTLDSAIEHLPGKVLEFHYMGVNEPEIAKIEEARLSSANYRYRDLFLSIEGNTSTTIPSDKIDEFLSGQMTFVKDSKGNEYGVQLTNVKMKDGGNIGQENNEMFHSQAKEAKHHIEELQKLLTQKTQIESWVLAKMTRAKTDLSDLTHYLEGQSNKMARGGKLSTAQQKKFDKVMHEWKAGKLHSGKNGPIVKDQDQAIAIAYSAARSKK